MKILLMLLVVSLIGTGCETLTGQQQRLADTRLYNEVSNLKMEVQRIEQRMAGMESERDAIYERLAGLQSGLTESDSRRSAELAAIHQQLNTQTLEQERMRLALATELSAKMAKILKSQGTPSSTPRNQTGYVHVVKAGQTLSEIAREYKVTSAAIEKANGLKDPNGLRVGQELFIPE